MESGHQTRWRTQLMGWRRGLFVLLGIYTLGATVFLLTGGGGPAMTSLVAMEAEVEGRDTPDESAPPSTVPVTDSAAAAPAVATDCSDIDPAQHSEDVDLGGVHALGFITFDELPAAFAGYQGCPLIVNFFASWCVPCVTEMPDFQQFWTDYGSEVAVVGLAVLDPPEEAAATVADRGVTYPTGLDDRELFVDLGGLGMPTTVFVSAAGDILETHSGLLTFDDIVNRANEHFGL